MNVKAISLQGGSSPIEIDKEPDVCPRCHTSVHPKLKFLAYPGDKLPEAHPQAAFQCTKDGCQELFIATYEPTGKVEGGAQLSTL